MRDWFLWWHSRNRWLFTVACWSKKWNNSLFIWGLISLRHKKAGSICLRCFQCGCAATAEYKSAMGLQQWPCQIQSMWTTEFGMFCLRLNLMTFSVSRGTAGLFCAIGQALRGLFTSQSTEVEEQHEAELWRTAAPVIIRKLNWINKTSNNCHTQMLKAGSLGKCKANVTYSMLTEIKYLSWVFLG